MTDNQEKICTDAAMAQWEASTKRPDLSEKDRVRGAIEAYKRQAFAFEVLTAKAEPSVSDYATRLFDLHGFMLLETYQGKHAVTVTFPDLQEARQFHGALVELSTHRPRGSELRG
ncbi:hypothetical protein J5277_09685 [Rhizobium sp. 16-449-1b]|uniref:hypothetical protein n=1 Tax=Rhizobium sp. 16-449-1b TaxID=2819989 RepID=UPI001ADB6D11|nr:hypothetical protein [Rhizobium sp. 16-449-1b]MBO9194376.1 hypothetical protein [Rhizobium sp. 16-449-1b]